MLKSGQNQESRILKDGLFAVTDIRIFWQWWGWGTCLLTRGKKEDPWLRLEPNFPLLTSYWRVLSSDGHELGRLHSHRTLFKTDHHLHISGEKYALVSHLMQQVKTLQQEDQILLKCFPDRYQIKLSWPDGRLLTCRSMEEGLASSWHILFDQEPEPVWGCLLALLVRQQLWSQQSLNG